MADQTIDTVHEQYNEDSDDDFDPTAASAAPPPDSSDDEDQDAAPTASKKSTAPQPAADDADLDFDNSGDELTIQSGKKRKRKTAGHDDDDDEGGEGGFVRTRAQRKAEGVEKKPLATTTQAKVDVNALWAEMSTSTKPAAVVPSEHTLATDSNANDNSKMSTTGDEPAAGNTMSSNLVTIKRRYDFAGQTIEEEKQVPAESAEAKLYLEDQAKVSAAPSAARKPGAGPPKRRKTPFGNFNPDNPTSTAPSKPAKKLNTIEKSRLDWAAHVDQQGLGEELDEASRAKGSYLGKVDFLDRMSARRDNKNA